MTAWTLVLGAVRSTACIAPWVVYLTTQKLPSWLLIVPLAVPLGLAILRELLRGSAGAIRLMGEEDTSRLTVLGHALVEYFVSLGVGVIWLMMYAVPALGFVAMVLAASVPIALEVRMAKSSRVLVEVWPQGGGLALENGERIVRVPPEMRVERAGSKFRFIDQGGALALRSGSLGAHRVVALLREHGIQPIVVPPW